jgi:hypothetical protein
MLLSFFFLSTWKRWRTVSSNVETLRFRVSCEKLSRVSVCRSAVAACLTSSVEHEEQLSRVLGLVVKKKINLGICIAPIQPSRAAQGAESRVCYPANTVDRQTQWALTYYHLSQSTANQNEKLIHCHRWDSNSWYSKCWHTSLTTQLSQNDKTIKVLDQNFVWEGNTVGKLQTCVLFIPNHSMFTLCCLVDWVIMRVILTIVPSPSFMMWKCVCVCVCVHLCIFVHYGCMRACMRGCACMCVYTMLWN